MTAPKKAASASASKAKAKTVNGLDDIVAISQDNVEAFVKAGSLFAEGIQNINKAWFELAQESATNAANVVDETL